MKDRQVSVIEPFLAGGLFSGAEVLLVLGLPLWVLIFCVVHAIRVADTVRAVQVVLPADQEVDVWSVVILVDLLFFSLLVSLAMSLVVVVAVGVGTLTWRAVAGVVDGGSQRRSYRRYRTLAGGDEMAADAWDSTDEAPGASLPLEGGGVDQEGSFDPEKPR